MTGGARTASGFSMIHLGSTNTQHVFYTPGDDIRSINVDPSIVGYARGGPMMGMGTFRSLYGGEGARRRRGILRIKYAFDSSGRFAHQELENLLTETVFDEYKRIVGYGDDDGYESLEDENDEFMPMIFSVSPHMPASEREWLCHTVMERHDRNCGIRLIPNAVLPLYSSGKTTGLDIRLGGISCQVTPVVNGEAVCHSSVRNDVGGRCITEELQRQFSNSGYSMTGGSDREIYDDIKASRSFVSLSAVAARESRCQETFELPDGMPLTLGAEVTRAPEVLFDYQTYGYGGDHNMALPTCIERAVGRVPGDLRGLLLSNAVLSGGTSRLRGMSERLAAEVEGLQAKVCNAPGREDDAFCDAHIRGGIMLGEAHPFDETNCVSSAEYDEVGMSAIHRFW